MIGFCGNVRYISELGYRIEGDKLDMRMRYLDTFYDLTDVAHTEDLAHPLGDFIDCRHKCLVILLGEVPNEFNL